MRRPVRRLVGDVLVTSTAGRRLEPHQVQGLSDLTGAEVDRLLLAASRHGVTGLLGAAVETDQRLPAELRTPVAAARGRVVRDHLRAVGELAAVHGRLAAAGVPWLLCKGPALAMTVYPQPHLREYTDLDVLVPESRLLDALHALTGAGFVVDGPDLAQLRGIGAGEIRLRSPVGLPVDLHWHLVNDPAVRSAFRVPSTTDLLAGARAVDLHGRTLLTLDPVDTLLHVALHACTSGGWRLLWLRDVLGAAHAVEPSTNELLGRSRSWGLGLVLGAMLDRAERVLRTPAGLDSARSSAPWLHLLAAVDRAVPVELATGQPSLTRITTNSTRRGSTSSALELARRTGGFSRDAMRRPRG